MNDFIVAESGIRQLHARCIDAVWRQDAEVFADCFTLDGEWKVGGMHLRGREEIGSTFARLLALNDRVLIIPGIPLLEIKGDEAVGRVQSTELAKLPDGSSVMTLGIFFDRYVQEGERWRFRWRHFSLHYRGPVDLSGSLVPSPDYGAFPGMPEWDEPTVTRLNKKI